MKCTAIQSLLSRKIDGELSDIEGAELEDHLAQCASCTREYRLLALPHRIAQAAPPLTPSPFFYQKLRIGIEGEAQKIAGWQTFLGLARQVVPTLAGITLALLSIFVYLQLRGPQADLYRAYETVFISEDQPHRMLVADQGEITDESVLTAIAERASNHRRSREPK